MKTIGGKFIIFNYNIKRNKKIYENEINDGKTPWFYAPPGFSGTSSYSIGFKTKEICYLVACIDECDQLIRKNQNKLKKVNKFIDDFQALNKNRMLNKSTMRDRKHIENMYATSVYTMKKIEENKKELYKRRKNLKQQLQELM